MAGKKYTDKQKIEYYKKMAQNNRKNNNRSNRKKSYRNGNSLGYNLGSAAGSLIPVAPGISSRLGGAIGSGVQALITGQGDYTVRKNSVLYNSDAVPMFTNDKRCTVITHKEFIRDIKSSVAFDSTEHIINPGDFKTFPWLSKIAQGYEEYIFQGIVFQYRSNSATAIGSTNTALGSVCMATQYNTLAPSFTSKHQMENYEFANSAVPCESFLHAIECDPKSGNEIKSVYNERDSDENADPRNYNLGRMTIGTQGMQSDSVIGELWVSYKVCLFKPRLGNNDNLADYYKLTDVIGTKPLGQTFMIPSKQNTGFTTQYSDTVVEFNPVFQGAVMVTVSYEISDFGAVAGTEFRCPNCVAATSNILDVSEKYLGSVGTMSCPRIERTENTGFVPIHATHSWVFEVDGGYSSSGNPASISFSGLIKDAGLALNDDAGRLSIIAIPSQAVEPEF